MRHLVALSLFLSACGGDALTVELSGEGRFDPFSDPRLSHVRLEVVGADHRVRTLAPEPAAIRLTDIRAGRVQVTGFDFGGNAIAFGRADVVEDAPTSVVLRRLLAFVTHQGICSECRADAECVMLNRAAQCLPRSDDCACAASQVCTAAYGCLALYDRSDPGPSTVRVVDVLSRANVDNISVGDPRAEVRSVRGGGPAHMVITYDTPGATHLGVISLADHRVESMELAAGQHLGLWVDDELVLAAGGGQLSLIDVDRGLSMATARLGGRILDGAVGLDGHRAVLITTASPYVVLLDLDRMLDGEDGLMPPGELPGASSVVVMAGGRRALVSAGSRLYELDLATAALEPRASGFTRDIEGLVVAGPVDRVHAVDREQSEVRGLDLLSNSEFDAVSVLEGLSGLAASPVGDRLFAVSSGTSTLTSGLSAIDEENGRFRVSTVPYPALAGMGARPDQISIVYGP